VFGAELRYYRTQAGWSQKELAASANVSHDVISKIETGERPPAEDFPPRIDAIPELGTRGGLTRLWGHLKKSLRQRAYGWFQRWANIEAEATALRSYEPLVVPGLLQTEDYARGGSLPRPDQESGRGEMDVTGVTWRKSTYSGDNGGNCVEVAAVWHKSSYSGDNGGTCVEVGTVGRAVVVRDSKDPERPSLAFAPDTWKMFAEQVKAGA